MLCKSDRLKMKQGKVRQAAVREYGRVRSDGKKRESTMPGRTISLRKTGNLGGTIICVLVCALVLNLGVSAAHRTFLQQGIAEEVLRFHVLANSDSEEDQSVKLLVRDAVLEWIKNVKQGEGQAEQKDTDSGKESELRFLSEHLSGIEETANRVLEEQGMPYRAQASVENCYFPERTYGNCTFPAGWYDALRIRLGAAKGHNWWCVLYPSLCFSDCLHAVVDDGELADLKEVLTVEEYESLLRKPKKWKIAFRWF